MRFSIQLQSKQRAEIAALINSGATANFLHQKLVNRYKIPAQELPQPITVRNADGTPNKMGVVTKYVEMDYSMDEHQGRARFLVTELGQENIILGLPWLQ
ncbi:hypothetical protein FA95DRAFT_1506600, partial [Auriscalpium vulgare]